MVKFDLSGVSCIQPMVVVFEKHNIEMEVEAILSTKQ